MTNEAVDKPATAAMNDSRPPDGEQQRVVADPRYWVKPSPLTGGVQVSFLDPERGWQHFIIPQHEITKLATLIVEHSCEPPVQGEHQ